MIKQKPIYDNCEIYGPDNTLVGLCSKERYEWYIAKGIAETIENKPNALKLKFEPKYRNKIDTSVRIRRENKCCACGAEENLVKYRVIPIEFKRFFPDEWKSHNSVDILPLCLDCSGDASSYAQDFKDQLCEDYDIYKDDFIDSKKAELKLLSKKILGCRKYGVNDKNMMDKLVELVGHEVTDEELNKFYTDITSVNYKDTNSPAEYIVKKIIEQNGMKEFIKRWKDNFITTMNPTDLPEDFYYDKY